MPTCCLCGTTFYRQSWDSPREDCECGGNVTRKEWRQSEEREPTEDELEQAREWRRALKGTLRRHEAEVRAKGQP